MTNDDLMTQQATRAFGVGCFNFRLVREVPFQFKVSDYVDHIERALCRLTSLSDLEITYAASAENRIFYAEANIPPLADGGGVFPFLPSGRICFTLFIPKRIQEDLIGSTDTQTEIFRISIYDQYHGPVSYIECVDAAPDCSPSTAVQVVREYLSKEFSKFEDVAFESLGPSPFHVDFYVHKNPETSTFDAIEIPDSGYEKIIVSSGNISKSPGALAEIYEAFGEELDLYYYLTGKRSIQINSWLELENQWLILRNAVNSPIRFWQISKKFENHKHSRELLSAAYTFSAASSIAKQNATESMRSCYGKGLKSYFKARSEALLEEAFPNYPVQAIISWATHIHDSSFKLAEIVTVLLSGLLGGFIGALVTALLTS